MTVETETILIKLLERIEAEVKETNQKLEKFIDTTNQKFENVQKDLTDLKVGQAKLEGEVKTLQVEVQNIKEDVKEIKTEQKDIRNDVSGLYKWVIVLIVGSGLSLGTLLLKAFDFFPKT